MVNDESLREILFLKHGDLAGTGWGPRLRKRFNYCTPDDIYEAMLLKLVAPGTRWLDVGGGRDLFPSNEALARLLSRRAAPLVGVDPSSNILDNPFVHVRVQSPIEDFHSDQTFDLITLRMVAEHIANPAAVVQSLERLAGPAGLIVI
jgi:2-polyprenyl-3-methyl-5-hydroxy-6-metoxy-1,4-benzoquinol methylase